MRRKANEMEENDEDSLLYNDPQATFTMEWINALRTKFIQGCVWIDELFPENHPLMRHPVLHDDLFRKYSDLCKFVGNVVEELPPVMAFWVSGTFTCNMIDSTLSLNHTSTGKGASLMNALTDIMRQSNSTVCTICEP